MRLKSFFLNIIVGVTHQTPAFSRAYRPAPPTLMGQIWAGLTRNTPAFTGARVSEASVSQEEQRPRERSEVRVWKVGPGLRASLVWAVPAAAVITVVVLVFVYSSPSTSAHHAASPPSGGVTAAVLVCAAFALLFWRVALRLAVSLLLVALVAAVVVALEYFLH